MKVALLVIVALFCVLSVSSQSSNPTLVSISNGLVQGYTMPTARVWKGVPFAAPPVDDLRFELPQPAVNWGNNVYQATQFKAGCPQSCTLPPLTCPTYVAEDCLYLNVWAPLEQSSTPLPVMFWIAGGHFDQGSDEDILYDAELVVNTTNVIIVEPNYRLGALGWLLTKDIQGNFGFYDQRFAINWVIENIAAFGGDPKQITLFGQSAGGTSTSAHIVSKDSAGLFQRAIIESNPWGLPLKSVDQALAIGDYFLEIVGCEFKGIKCLKALNVSEIVRAEAIAEKLIPIYDPIELFYPFTPVVDGVDIVQNPLDAFMAGNYDQNIPIVTGTVLNESLMFINEAFPTGLPPIEMKAVIEALFPGNLEAILNMYPIPPGTKDARGILSILGTDYLFTCPQRAMARGVANQNGDLWLYFYNHTVSFYNAWGPNFTECWLPPVVCHASELPIVFRSAGDANFTYTPEELELSVELGTLWTNHAKTGNPNLPVTPTLNWPQYVTSSSTDYQFNTPSFTESFIFDDYCNFWDGIGYKTDILAKLAKYYYNTRVIN